MKALSRPRVIAGIVIGLIVVAIVLVLSLRDDDEGTGASGDGSLSRVRAEGLRVAFYGEEPYSFIDENGEFTGVEVDLAREVAEKLDIPEITHSQVAFDALVPGVVAGRYDFPMAGLSVTEERMEVATPIDPFFYFSSWPFVASGNPHDIHSTQDLVDKDVRIGAVTAAPDAPELEAAGVDSNRLVPFDDIPAMYAALEQGRIEVLMHSSIGGALFLEETGSTEIEMADPWEPIEELTYRITWYMNPQDDTLREAVNEAVAELKADGTVEELLEKWGIGAEFMLE